MPRRASVRSAGDRFLMELEPHRESLWRMALRLCGETTRAEDVLQEAILKAWRFFDTFKPGTNFRAWIHRVLYTVFINTTRDREPKAAPFDSVSEPAVEKSSLVNELDRPGHRERERAILEASDERIKHAVDELPPDLRTVFLLSTIEGLKYREIAEVMDCPLGTVMSRLFRSRRWLQDRLSGYARETGFLKGPGPALDAGETEE
jgi:RNA polymerase sigma-70 factor (ECF subfamily)